MRRLGGVLLLTLALCGCAAKKRTPPSDALPVPPDCYKLRCVGTLYSNGLCTGKIVADIACVSAKK
jgi:hypothetical protein